MHVLGDVATATSAKRHTFSGATFRNPPRLDISVALSERLADTDNEGELTKKSKGCRGTSKDGKSADKTNDTVRRTSPEPA